MTWRHRDLFSFFVLHDDQDRLTCVEILPFFWPPPLLPPLYRFWPLSCVFGLGVSLICSGRQSVLDWKIFGLGASINPKIQASLL